MNFIGKALAGITAMASVMVPVEASTFEDHIRLAQTIEERGVDFLLNPVACGSKNALGWYHAYSRTLVVCQENATPGGPEVAWTEEDLDTLRHEAHHLVQDCMDDNLNGSLESVYQSPSKLVTSVLTKDQILTILDWYSDATDNRKLMELEAFSVAILNNPVDQISDIHRYCF